MDENRITYFAETDARNKKVKFGIKAKDRTRHVYVIGKTGMGKSCLLENMAVQDIQNGEGLCFIDPHGKTADLLLEYVPKDRIKDVILIAPFDTEYPISFNVLESVDPEKRHLVVSGLMSTFKKIWVDAWSARMEYILTNTLLALLECPGSTLLGVNKMLSDKAYRKEVVAQIQDPSVKSFWVNEFANYTERMAAEAVPSIQNKVGQFTANPLIRNMIGQPVSSFDFREAMDSKKILIINLSKGRIGDENMKLLGGLLVTKIYLAAMSRADVPDRVLKTLPNFYLFVDEFQNFANASFADILSEARKYKLNLTIAHQYVEQVDEFVRPAVFGNVGTMIVFRVGATDAEFLEKEFVPQFEIEDLVNLGFAQIYLKLMIDGLTSSPFSGTTLPPIAHPDVSYVKEIVDSSRAQFAKPRAQVEEIILKFHDAVPKSASASKAFTGSGPSSSGQGSAGSYKPPVASPNSFSASKLPINTGLSVASGPTTPMASPTTTGQVTSPSPSAPKAVAPTTPSIPAVPRPATAMTPSSASPTPSSYNSPKPPVRPAAPAPTITPRPSPSQSPSQLRPQSQPPKPTPVSLSSLAQNTNQRQDPKIPSPKNIGDLKSALAAALSKANAEKVQQGINKSKAAISDNRPVSQPVPQPKPQPQPVQQPKPATAQPPIPSAKPILPTNQVPPAKPVVPLTPVPAPVLAPAPVSQPPLQPQPAAQLKPQSKEVPEDVLKDVLKMD